MRKVARTRFEKEVGRLGRTWKNKWAELPEAIELSNLQATGVKGILNQPARLNELILMKAAFKKRFAGSRQILGEQEAKFARHPAFGNKIFPKETVALTEKFLNDKSQDWLKATCFSKFYLICRLLSQI